MGHQFSIFCDGSSSGYGSAYCLYLKNGGIKRSKRLISKTFDEEYNVLQIEFLAILGALKLLLDLPNHKATIFSDSLDVINILNNNKQPPKFLEKFIEEYTKLEKELEAEEKIVRYLWLSRNTNLAGRYLEKRLIKLKRTYR